MKILSKFKQLNKDIKLIIITALIASCIGVYATGECIISATADNVSYNNTTVQSAIDDLFSMSANYCPPGYECTPRTMYSIMAKNSVLDNIASTYVTSSTGINFSQISSDTNGKGIYEIASTKNDTYPIYYYRGAVDDNNVKFAGFCWKAIRTTDTGGVKIIYNGEQDQDGYCTNTTGDSTQIGANKYNTNYNSISDIGYMYGKRYTPSTKTTSELTTSFVFGNDVTYSNGTYTLTNTMTTTGTWSNDYNTLSNNHYTCWTTGTTCSSVYYVYYTYTAASATYITLTGGNKVEDAIEEMLTNVTNSTAKTTIDNWYNNNLTSYTSYIEDTVYCNDRSISSLGGWNRNGGYLTDGDEHDLYFNPYTRTFNNYSPSLTCSRVLDKFTVSSSKGNGALTYPIGLITSDEAMYAGGKGNTANSTYYLYTNQEQWTISPVNFFKSHGGVFLITASGSIAFGNGYTYKYAIRPVISLASADVVISGDGTATNPYVIKTN